MSKAPQCPICRHSPAHRDHAPFCSARCRDLDMGRWLSGAYRVPIDEPTSPPAAPESGNGRSPE